MADSSTKQANILRSLAMGINPVTGELLPDGMVDQPDVIRALFFGAEAIGRRIKEADETDALATDNQVAQAYGISFINHRAPWTEEQDELLENMFHAQRPVVQMMKSLGRTTRGLAARLVRLGLIENRVEFYEFAKKSAMSSISLRNDT